MEVTIIMADDKQSESINEDKTVTYSVDEMKDLQEKLKKIQEEKKNKAG
jgi:hypothetical protein